MESAPQFLYRYRPNKDYVLNELEAGEIRFSSAASFDDLGDCSLRLPDGKTLHENVQAGLAMAASSPNPIATHVTFEEVREALDLPLEIPAEAKKLTLSEALSMERDEDGSFCSLASKFSSPVATYAPHLEAQLKQLKVLCLTARCDNEHMWKHYANDGRGVVFEYATADLHSIDGDVQALSLPVMYTGANTPAMMVFAAIESGAVNRDHQTTQLLEQILLLRTVYTKDPGKYAKEEEWRLCASSRPGENGLGYVTRRCMPRTVYLGMNMDKSMKTRL